MPKARTSADLIRRRLTNLQLMDDKIAAERAFLIESWPALVKKLAEEREAWEAKRSGRLRQLKIEVTSRLPDTGSISSTLPRYILRRHACVLAAEMPNDVIGNGRDFGV